MMENPERDVEVYGQVEQTRMAGCLPQRRSPAMQLGRWNRLTAEWFGSGYHHHLCIGGNLQPSGDNHQHRQPMGGCRMVLPRRQPVGFVSLAWLSHIVFIWVYQP